jgi:hypothetical protein
MNKLSIAPNFIPGENGDFFFTHQQLNKISRARYQDDFGFYQRTFNPFTYMPMDRRNNFVVHYPKGTPLMWQPYKACSYESTGSMTLDRRELTPDPIYMREQFCHDILFDSCFEHMLQYTQGGDIVLDNEGIQIFNTLVDELLANAQLGFRISAVAGQIFDVNSVDFSTDNTANLTSLFKRTHPTMKGVLKLAYDMARVSAPWLDQDLVTASDFDATGEFTGNPVELVEKIMGNARKPLKVLYNRGRVVTNSRFNFMPEIIASDSYYNAFLRQYNDEGKLSMTNRTRLTKEEFNDPQVGRIEVLYLDGRIPIIPLSEINGFDPYVAGNLHALMVTGSGNLQIGASFASLPQDMEGRDIGVMIGRNDDMNDDKYGMYTVLSHALGKTAIADVDYLAGTIKYTKPA